MFSVRKFSRILNTVVLVYAKYGLIWQKNLMLCLDWGMNLEMKMKLFGLTER